ncbi:MAG TPA: DUF983 domain-containing protein [Blastocatellia bacterium]|nr:DUF983 domain-containing protein [Blastocatellia bacterium]
MNYRRAATILYRGIRLKCPDCGEASIYRSLFNVKHHCSHCGLLFAREQGYFVGAIYINVVVTESLLLFTFLAYLIAGAVNDQTVYYTLFVLAIAVPLLFFHHSRSLWLAIDHMIDPIKTRIDLDQVRPSF